MHGAETKPVRVVPMYRVEVIRCGVNDDLQLCGAADAAPMVQYLFATYEVKCPPHLRMVALACLTAAPQRAKASFFSGLPECHLCPPEFSQRTLFASRLTSGAALHRRALARGSVCKSQCRILPPTRTSLERGAVQNSETHNRR